MILKCMLMSLLRSVWAIYTGNLMGGGRTASMARTKGTAKNKNSVGIRDNLERINEP